MQFRPRLTEDEYKLIQKHRDKTERRILVVGDIHAPFELKEYLQFCKDTYAKFSCNQVLFLAILLTTITQVSIRQMQMVLVEEKNWTEQ